MPSLRHGLMRVSAVTGAVALLGTSLAAPANAQSFPEAWSSLSFTSISTYDTAANGGIYRDVYVGHNGHPDLPDRVTVEIDASGAADILTLSVIGGGDCTAAGAVTTCETDLPDLADTRALEIHAVVNPAAQPGDTGTITLTTSGDGIPTFADTEEITVIAAEIRELQVKDYFFDDVVPGQTVAYQPIVHNSGTLTAEYVVLTLDDARYVRHTQRFSNCAYLEHEDGTSTARCEFALDLAPGETAQVPTASAVELRVAEDSPHRHTSFASYQGDGYDGQLDPEGEFGDGPELVLEKVADAGLDDGNVSWANVAVRAGANPADLAAVGADISGEVGERVTVTVGIENHGPADLMGTQPGEGAAPPTPVIVNFPAGVTVTELLPPAGDLAFTSSCFPLLDGEPDFTQRNVAAGNDYHCLVSELTLRAGQAWLFPFEVEILSADPDAGEVTVTTEPNDPNHDNNTAAITLHGAGAGGGLPVTGAATALLGVGGLLVLGLGAGLFLLARRRRIAFTSEPAVG